MLTKIISIGLLIIILCHVCSSSESSPVQHPLDPLNDQEIRDTVSLIKSYRWGRLVFNYMTLKEPPKVQLLPFFLKDTNPPPGSIARRTFTLLYDREHRRTYEVTVNLQEKKVEKWEDAPKGVNYGVSQSELKIATRITKNHTEVIERCRALGWSNMTLVKFSPWPIVFVEDRPEFKGKRLMQVFLNGKMFPDDNENTHPFDFLPIVDLDEGRVITIEELPTDEDLEKDKTNKLNTRVPTATSQIWKTTHDPFPLRNGLNPINISQPGGPSFTIDGNEIRWQKFKFRLGFNGREGLILHNVNYKDGDAVRPLFYRMSLAEMYVPYGDPRPPFHRKAVLDEGDYGIGLTLMELKAQVDCVGEVRFFSWPLYDENGEPYTNKNSVCVFEEDTGILWKHTDFRTGRSTVVRAQRLSVTFIATFHTYDYVMSWNFYQDGSIEFNFKLTGLLSTNLYAKGGKIPRSSTIVFPQIIAQHHQHYFTLRLDPEIDGGGNSVAEVDFVPLEAPTGSKENPYGQGFTSNTTVFKTAGAAKTNPCTDKSRTWHIMNPTKFHPYNGKPVAYKLQPFQSTPLMMRKDSPMHKRVAYMDYATWVTPYNDEQMYPAGFYINGSGLPDWVKRDPNANIENTDVVLWYTVGSTHIPRAEDFPAMPAEPGRVFLRPVNFFKENPALDVPGPMEGRKKDEL